MISSLIYYGAKIFSLPLPIAFYETSTRMLLAFLTSLILCLSLGPSFIRKLIRLKFGQHIRDYKGFLLTELHKDKKNTPTMGGALIIFSVVVSTLLWADWSSIFTPLVVSSLVFFGSIGMIDDYAKLRHKSSDGLSGKVRLFVQSLFAIVVMALLFYPESFQKLGFSIPLIQDSGITIPWKTYISEMNMPFCTDPVLTALGGGWLFIWLLQWLTMTGTANAVNLTDGLDGLACGLSVLAACALMIVAFISNHQELATHHTLMYVESSGEIAVALAALIGAGLGFLWFNGYPAQVFMGDTGSLALGGMIGTAAVLMRREWLLALVGALFVVETLSVIMQVLFFKKSGKRLFRCAPIHHHFEFMGLHEAKVVVRFWIIGFLLLALGIISIKFQ
jgi:phospho-N-acetylmuramoyl-pentapeptide-transferase